MKLKSLVLLILLFANTPLFAQSVDTAWVRRYDGPANGRDNAYAVVVDDSNNVYVSGYSWGSKAHGMRHPDYATIKYGTSGNLLWVQIYNGLANSGDYAYDVAVDDSGKTYVVGMSIGSGTSGDYTTIKYEPNGDTAWVRRYNGPGDGWDYARAIAVDDSGYVYVTGMSYGSETRGDYATIKYYSNGDTAWIRRYNGPGNAWDYARAIAVDNDGNVYVTGFSEGDGTLCDYATIKYYSNGDVAFGWPKRYNGPGNDYDLAQAIAIDDLGNVYVTGDSWANITAFDYATIMYNSSGDELWVKRYDGAARNVDYANAIVVDNQGNVYVTGQSTGPGTDLDYLAEKYLNFDYVTIKYYPNGETAPGWPKTYGGPGNWDDCANAICVNDSGNVYVTGLSFDSGTWFDFATMKYDSMGNECWVIRYDGPAEGRDDVASAITVDSSANVYVTGGSSGSGSDWDYATIKYVEFLRGDVCKDNEVNIEDVVNMINDFLKPSISPISIPQAGDVNCDETTDITDIIYLINYVLKSGPPPCQ